MTISLTISGESFHEFEQQLNELTRRMLGGQAPRGLPTAQVNATATGNVPPVVSPQLRQHMSGLKSQSRRTTGKTWRMVHTIAEEFVNEFKLDDVRQKLAVPAGHVKAWRRNVGKWSNGTGVAIFEHVPGTHHPNIYRMPADVRAAVLQLGA
jgi:hypothetical protein